MGGCVGPRAGLDGVGEKNNLLPLLDSNPGHCIKSFHLMYIYYCEHDVELQVPIKAGIFFWQAEQPSTSQEAACTMHLNLAWSREGCSSPWNWPLLHRIGLKRCRLRRHVLCILEFLCLIILAIEPLYVLQKKKNSNLGGEIFHLMRFLHLRPANQLTITVLALCHISSLLSPPYRCEGVWLRQRTWELYQR